mmetsp:Transcript_22568/g.49364  ORF Transcript_22568/g.49364 Transcript_22568/m.49364 type:complete len:240 (+) Transcript_22568:484-1203(+)
MLWWSTQGSWRPGARPCWPRTRMRVVPEPAACKTCCLVYRTWPWWRLRPLRLTAVQVVGSCGATPPLRVRPPPRLLVMRRLLVRRTTPTCRLWLAGGWPSLRVPWRRGAGCWCGWTGSGSACAAAWIAWRSGRRSCWTRSYRFPTSTTCTPSCSKPTRPPQTCARSGTSWPPGWQTLRRRSRSRGWWWVRRQRSRRAAGVLLTRRPARGKRWSPPCAPPRRSYSARPSTWRSWRGRSAS